MVNPSGFCFGNIYKVSLEIKMVMASKIYF